MTGWQTVCGTGHRKLTDPGAQPWLRDKLFRCAEWLRDVRGTEVVLSGMARGFDMRWADTIIQTPGLQLWACIPFEEQTAPWTTAAERREWERLCGLADKTLTVGVLDGRLAGKARNAAINQLLYGRNVEMLSMSAAVVGVWERGRLTGGTAGALLEAARRGMPGVHLDPAARRVFGQLPPAGQLLRQVLYHRDCGHIAQLGAAADLEPWRTALHAAGRREWLTRPARPRDRRGSGCPVCRPTLHPANPATTCAVPGQGVTSGRV